MRVTFLEHDLSSIIAEYAGNELGQEVKAGDVMWNTEGDGIQASYDYTPAKPAQPKTRKPRKSGGGRKASEGALQELRETISPSSATA